MPTGSFARTASAQVARARQTPWRPASTSSAAASTAARAARSPRATARAAQASATPTAPCAERRRKQQQRAEQRGRGGGGHAEAERDRGERGPRPRRARRRRGRAGRRRSRLCAPASARVARSQSDGFGVALEGREGGDRRREAAAEIPRSGGARRASGELRVGELRGEQRRGLGALEGAPEGGVVEQGAGRRVEAPDAELEGGDAGLPRALGQGSGAAVPRPGRGPAAPRAPAQGPPGPASPGAVRSAGAPTDVRRGAAAASARGAASPSARARPPSTSAAARTAIATRRASLTHRPPARGIPSHRRYRPARRGR